MTNEQYRLWIFVTNTLVVCLIVFGLFVLNGSSYLIKNQAYLHDNFNAELQVNRENAEEIKSRKLLKMNDEINQFTIYEFKNIYRVKA